MERLHRQRCGGLTRMFRSASFKKSRKLRWYAATFEMPAPSIPACYVFILRGKVVYVGSTNDLSARLRAHRNRKRPTPWVMNDILVKYRPSKKWGDWAMLELRLIRRLRPIGNEKFNVRKGGRDA